MDDMVQVEGSSGGEGAVAPEKKKGPRLIDRTRGERWRIPRSLRGPLINRLGQIIKNPTASDREVLAAASALLSASKINLANIDLTMKVLQHEELEEQLTALEHKLDGVEAGVPGSPKK
jgi:hypothetical protein